MGVHIGRPEDVAGVDNVRLEEERADADKIERPEHLPLGVDDQGIGACGAVIWIVGNGESRQQFEGVPAPRGSKARTLAPASIRPGTRSSAGAPRMSSVSGLKVSPRRPIVRPATSPPNSPMTRRAIDRLRA